MKAWRLAITGHRPHKLGGFSPTNPMLSQLEQHLRVTLEAIRARGHAVVGLTGMAQGIDQAFARACQSLGIPFHAFIPFEGQERLWPTEAQAAYTTLRRAAAQEIVVVPSAHTPHDVRQAFLLRNSRLVDDCDAAIAVWDGTRSGTADAVEKLRRAGKPLLILHPNRPYHPDPVATWITATFDSADGSRH